MCAHILSYVNHTCKLTYLLVKIYACMNTYVYTYICIYIHVLSYVDSVSYTVSSSGTIHLEEDVSTARKLRNICSEFQVRLNKYVLCIFTYVYALLLLYMHACMRM